MIKDLLLFTDGSVSGQHQLVSLRLFHLDRQPYQPFRRASVSSELKHNLHFLSVSKCNVQCEND